MLLQLDTVGVLIWLGVQDIFYENALKGIELLISYFVVSAQSFWTFLFNKLSKTKTKKTKKLSTKLGYFCLVVFL